MKHIKVVFLIALSLFISGCATNPRGSNSSDQSTAMTQSRVNGSNASNPNQFPQRLSQLKYADKQDELLAAFQKRLNANHLTRPKGNNALTVIETYEKTFPNDPVAKWMRQQVAERYFKFANAVLSKSPNTPENTARAKRFVDRALEVAPHFSQIERVITLLSTPAPVPQPVKSASSSRAQVKGAADQAPAIRTSTNNTSRQYKNNKNQKVIRRSLSSDALAARTNVIRNEVQRAVEISIAKQGDIVIYSADENDAAWLSGVVKSMSLNYAQTNRPRVTVDSSKAWKPTIDIVFPKE